MTNLKTSEDLERSLGEQFRHRRIQSNFDQEELARMANVSIGALKHLENGQGTSLKTMIKVVRALGMEDWLYHLSPQVSSISPLALLRAEKMNKPRRKVYRERVSRSVEKKE